MKQSAIRRTTQSRRFINDEQRKAAMANILQRHQGLVRKEANVMVRRLGPIGHQSREDLIQAGNEGLMAYARRYDPNRSMHFSTGAIQAIRAKIQREAQKSKVVRVPEKKVGKLAKLGALPTTYPLVDLKEKASSGGIPQAEARADIHKMLLKLPARDAKVIRLRYLEDRTLSQVSKRLRIPSPQVKKIETRALKHLQKVA